MNRTLTEKARCLLIQASLTEQLWGEAILTAAFIHNRIPSRTHGKCPFALWSGSAPGLKHIRVFGCYASVVIAHELRKSKFQSVVNEGIFIGYSRARKAYRVLLKDGTITEARDVVFDEKLFPGTSAISGFDNDVYHQTGISDGGSSFAPLPTDSVMPDAPGSDGPSSGSGLSSLSESLGPEISLQGEEVMDDASDISDGYFPSDQELDDAPPSEKTPMSLSTVLDGPIGRYDDVSDDDMPLNIYQRQQPVATCTTVAVRNNEGSIQPISSVILPNPMAVNGVRTFDERDSDTDDTPSRSKPTTAPEDDIDLDPGVYHRSKLLLKNTPDIVLIAAPSLTFNQAMKSTEKDFWHDACVSEYNSLMENNTWVLVPKPAGRKIVGCKWVFKVKENTDGTIDKYKARLVAQGFSQSPGIDYQETFAPVVRYETVRFLFAVSAQLGFSVHHMDVTTAFLNGKLEERIYMRQPPGFEDQTNPDHVCLLKKSLYGLKQAPLCWNIAIFDVLTSLGFQRNESDYGLFSRGSGSNRVLIALYVDDLLISGADTTVVSQVKSKLSSKFKMKDLGLASHFLGMRVNQTGEGITLDLAKYITDILKCFSMENCKSAPTPLPSVNLSVFNESDPNVDSTLYRSIIGKLIYAANAARPDLATAVSFLSRYLQAPKKIHLKAAKHCLRYLAGTINLGITYSKQSSFSLTGYVDADYAQDESDRISVTGYVFMLAGGPITWASRKQKSPAASSTEAEYVALSEASNECVWLLQLGSEMNISIPTPVTLFEDNQGCIAIAENPVHHHRTKHISVKYHISRHLVKNGTTCIQYLNTEVMIADMFTKPLGKVRFPQLRDLLGMCYVGDMQARRSVGRYEMPTNNQHIAACMYLCVGTFIVG